MRLPATTLFITVALSYAMPAAADEPAESANRFADVVAAADGLSDHVAATTTATIHGNVAPWTDTQLELAMGDAFSIFAAGELILSTEPMVAMGPDLALWYRIGEQGEIFSADATHSYTAETAGKLYAAANPISWTTRTGNYLGEGGEYPSIPGGFQIAAIKWKGDAVPGLMALAEATGGVGPAAAEIKHLATAPLVPQGWHHLWRIGANDIHRDMDFGGEQGQGIRAHVDSTAGILKKPLDIPFTDDTVIEWDWRATKLPSNVAENTPVTHDYMSIAVEFDNGQDLTYFWSSALPVEHGHTCPLAWWNMHETHVVLKSGEADLGKWLSESRALRPDYDKYVTIPAGEPRRIIGIWIISVGAFSKSVGIVDYANITLKNRHGTFNVQ